MISNYFRINGFVVATFCFGLLAACSQTNNAPTAESPASTAIVAIPSPHQPYPAPVATPIPTAYPAPATIEVIEATHNAAVQLTLTAQPTLTPIPTTCPASSVPDSYVGCQHPPMPQGLEAPQWWLMSDFKTSETIHAFSVVMYDNLRMLWLDKYLGERGSEPFWLASNPTYWEVRAVLVLPNISEDETFVNDCRVIGAIEADPEIFAVAETKPTADLNLDIIKQAWRANRKTSAFEQIPTEGIVCFISPMEYWR